MEGLETEANAIYKRVNAPTATPAIIHFRELMTTTEALFVDVLDGFNLAAPVGFVAVLFEAFRKLLLI